MAFAANYTFLSIDGMCLTADAGETYAFISDLYDRNAFNFKNLLPWLRDHTTLTR